MKIRQISSFFLVVLFVFNSFAFAAPTSPKAVKPSDKFVAPSLKAVRWAENALRKMTTDEKIGQLISVGVNAGFWNQDSEAYQDLKRQVVENKIGGIILFRSPVFEAVHLTNRMQQLAKIPLLISSDFESGVGMRFNDTVSFPWNMAVAATGEPELARRQGALTAIEARALGVQQVFAPVVDVNNNAANPVINVRAYSEDPAEVSRFANAFIEGLQANNALATAKHFPGHGDTAVDSHRGLPIIGLPRSRLDRIELVPFRSAIEHNIASVMVAHIALPQIDATEAKPLERYIKTLDFSDKDKVVSEKATIPATLSPAVSTELLKRQLGFRGLVVTDSMSMGGLTLYYNQDEAAVLAFLAGADVLLKPADVDAAIRGLRRAVESGRISEERLNESVRKILAVKYELGLAANRLVSVDAVDRTVAGKQTRDLADEIAAKAITLVKNEKNILPLPAATKPQRILVLAMTNGDDRLFVANYFTEALARQNVKFDLAILDERSSPKEIAAAREAAGKADLIVAPLYGRVRTGEARSISLPDSSAAVLRELLDKNAPLVGVSFGNPYLLQEFPNMKTYLVTYGDMASLQRAAARAVFGQQDITGRLPITLPGLAPRGTGIQIKRQ